MASELRDSLARPGGVARVAVLLAVPAAALALTRSLGGAAPGLPFLALLAVLAAGRWFGWLVGAVEGLYAALLLGPLVGTIRVVPPGQANDHWWGPMLFFVALGAAAGTATEALRRRLQAERAERRELTKVHARTLVTFANVVAHRDQPTAYHCERVAENARTLGRQYGLEGNDLDALYWAGMLHDLGKIATPAGILLKDGKLTVDEYDIIKQHPVMGSEMLLDISPRFGLIAEGVRCHHERWDGSGYPDGLSGTDIPLFGRLLAVVDVFEAMTAPRPYRGPLRASEVMSHLREKAGVEFDPEIVRLFAQLHRRRLIHTYADGYPTPTDLDTGIFDSGFWAGQTGPVGREPPDPARPLGAP